MPLFDYKCPCCGNILRDLLVKNRAVVVECKLCGAEMTPQPSAPSSFKVEGFSARNGYASERNKTR